MIAEAPREVSQKDRQSDVIIDLFPPLESQLRSGGQMFSQSANITASVAHFKANREPSYNDSLPAWIYNSAVEDHADKVPAAGDCVTVWLPPNQHGTLDLTEVRVGYHYLPGAGEYDSTRRLTTDPRVRFWARTGDDEAFQLMFAVGFHPYNTIDSASANEVSWTSWVDNYLGRPYLVIGSGKTARIVELEFDSNGQPNIELDNEAQGVIDTFNQVVAAHEGAQQQQRAHSLGHEVVNNAIPLFA